MGGFKMEKMMSGLLWSFLAFFIIGIIGCFYSRINPDRKNEVINMFKIMVFIWLASTTIIIIIFNAS